MFCRSLFVLLYFFFWSLCCLYFFDLRILITFYWIFKLFLRSGWKWLFLYTNCWISLDGITTVILIVIFIHIPSVYEFARYIWSRGGFRGGGRTRRAPPLKLEKIWFFWRKIVIFHTKYPKIFTPPSARRNFFKCAPPPNLKSWIRPCDLLNVIWISLKDCWF